jgi:hypothetical protein
LLIVFNIAFTPYTAAVSSTERKSITKLGSILSRTPSGNPLRAAALGSALHIMRNLQKTQLLVAGFELAAALVVTIVLTVRG